MAVNFPNSPTDGQEFTAEGVTWQWDAAGDVWIIVSGAGEGFLPLVGGTIAGDLNVVGTTTAIGPFTAQVGAVFESGLTALDDVQVESGDVLLQGGGLRYTNLAGTTALGQILAAGGFIEFRHGAAGTRIAHYDGANWYMDLDMDVAGNVDIDGSLTVGGVEVPKITEFHDPNRAVSWRIVGTTLEVWGKVNGNANGLATVIYPKGFTTFPLITVGSSLTNQPIGGRFILQAHITNPRSLTQADFNLMVFDETLGSVFPDTGNEYNYHAIGEWDGVS